MRSRELWILILLVGLLVVELSAGRGSRGSRSGGRASGSNRSRNSKARTSSGSKSRSTTRITKYTPIPAKTRSSPVIVSQTKVGKRGSTFKKVLAGYFAMRYFKHIARAPVYRQGYPMYGRYVRIPEEHAVRVMSTETKMLDRHDEPCVNKGEQNVSHNISDEAEHNVVEVNMTIRYAGEARPQPFNGIDAKFTLREKEGLDFEIVSRTRYNATLVPGKDCVVVEERANGTILRLYETNPNGAAAVASNPWLYVLMPAIFWLTNEGHFDSE